MEPLNVSDHTIVYATIQAEVVRTKRKTTKVIKRPNWKRCDKNSYQASILKNLHEINIQNLSSSAEEIEKLTNILHMAGKDAIPNYRKQVTSKAIGNETNRNEEIKQANEEEVTLSILKLKTGKSPGADGITAEHLKNMPTELLQYSINIINLIFKEKDAKVKEGVVTPVLKSGKDKIYPENHRGITVTNCFSTLIESIPNDRIEPKLLPQQSKLQRGFTEKSSSLNSAFIVIQSADFYKEILAQLVLLTLDAQKAFDKLDHEILFNKLYHDGITGNIWILLRNMYKNVAVKVKWDNTLSDQFIQRQGVRQGAKRSTILYKRYNNNRLDALDRADIGAKIGNISVVAPTCTLQSDREKFTRGRESDKCLLCETSREDTHHFLITCTALKMERDKHLSVLKSYLKNNTSVGTFDRVEEQGLIVLFILNPSATKFKELFKLKKSICKDIEAITRTLCYSLHIKRTLLNQTKA
ncbi:uncharacterized protein LOC134726592 [Mytilus trossulus]|uniref:uncharacterized protein LOC134726592 n=1 Tax=Mytilus trossulus TaxID=6551 RepID=UPI0030050576